MYKIYHQKHILDVKQNLQEMYELKFKIVEFTLQLENNFLL